MSMSIRSVRSTPILFAFGTALLLFSSAAAHAQIFYEPVRAQYPSPYGQPPHYYYGGSDPRVSEFAQRYDSRFARGIEGKGSHIDANGMQRIPVSPTVRVYSDCAPFVDLSQYGWTPADAINEANARMPLYYRRTDSPPAGAPGVWVVPANGEPSMQIEPPATPRAATVGAPKAAGTILIIPKRLLKPIPKPTDKVVASAQ